MWIMTLDVKATHANNPECPMRLVQQPNHQWMCSDCGREILWKRIEVEPVKSEAEAMGQAMAHQFNEAMKPFTYQVTREHSPTYSISEVQPMAIANARAIKKQPLSFKQMLEMVQAVAPEDQYSMGAPVDAFDRDAVMCCCSDDGTTANANYFANQTPPLAIAMASNPDFLNRTGAGWKAIDEGHSTTLSLQQLRKICGLD